jgi:hypothetical protein
LVPDKAAAAAVKQNTWNWRLETSALANRLVISPRMTRAEISALLEPATFKPFVMVTHAGRFPIPHPDFIDIPPHDEQEPEPSFIVVYTKTGTPRFVVLLSIDHIEVEPITRS